MRSLVLLSGLATGGAERVTLELLRALERTSEPGLEVLLGTVTNRHDGPLATELDRLSVARHDLGARRLADPAALWRLRRLLLEKGVDLVHAHGQDASILAAAAVAGRPLVITRHVLEEPRENWRQSLRASLSLWAARRADAVVAVSTAVAHWLSHAGGVPPQKIRVIHNGIDCSMFSSPALRARRSAIRAALGLSADAPVALMTAVLRPGKGHDVLLAAVPRIRARVPEVRILLAGGGELEPQLRQQAARHGDAVRLLGPRDDVAELLQACDLVVLPSHAEGLPLTLLEAAAAARPVVASRVGGVEEVVEAGRTGILVPAADPEALADAVVELLRDGERAEALAKQGQARVVERFSIEGHAASIVDLWSQVLAGR